jgi:RNA polymerase sigma-54 factor
MGGNPMDMNISGNIELNQKLIITPQLQQFVKILQMGQQELNSFAEQQALENPVIEIEPNYDELEYTEKIKKKLDWLEDMDEENRVYYQSSQDKDDYEYTAVSDHEESLQHYLLSQLELLSLDDSDYKIVKYIIQSLNENGYLDTNIEDIAITFNTTKEHIEKNLGIVQSFEPSGVGARDLKECLMIQLKNKGIEDKNLFHLINYYLDELGKNKLNVISKELGISIEAVKDLYSIIKTLNPHPGGSFSSGHDIRYIKPDIIVVKFKDYYEVLLNDLAYPKMSISNYYKNILDSSNDRETRSYIAKKIEQASWIMKCIEQRNNTLLSVAKTIVDIQKQFFDKGPGNLIPMILKDVAEKLSIHESTVSRAIHDKFLQSSWGIFELKYFFSSGFDSKTQGDMTSENIKLVLKEIINSENKKKPYSDQKIADILCERGLKVARRTVAKYREELNIPAASVRKEF